MSEYLVTPDGKRWIPEGVSPPPPPPTGANPVPVDFVPVGARYDAQTPGRFGRAYHDDVVLGHSRTLDGKIKIQSTNEMIPLREYKIKDGEYKVFPTSKCIVKIQNTAWETWLRELMGTTVFENFRRDGYGFMDNGPDNLHALLCGGNLVYEYGTHKQTGQSWSLVATMDYNEPLDKERTYDNSPHLFIKQYYVFSTAAYPIGWTVDKGEIGGNGDVIFPRVTKTEAALETNLIEFYKKPPFQTVIYNRSRIEEYTDSSGLLKLRDVPQSDLHGIPVTVDELCFIGSNTYARVGDDWYLVEEMLIRGDYSDKGKAGNWLDFRSYWQEERRAHPVAIIGWIKDYKF